MSPDIRKHRGAHPKDRKLFGDDQLTALRTAVDELSWLLTRDYTMKAALKLVGESAPADRSTTAGGFAGFMFGPGQRATGRHACWR